MAESTFVPPPRKRTFLDHSKLQLRAPNSAGKMASLQWRLVNSNPRIVVYTNDPNDVTDRGMLNANMDSPTLFALLRMIEEAAHSTGVYRAKIDNLNYTFPGGKRSESPSVVSSTIVSRDEEGQVSLMISAPRRPQIKFTFINPEFHHFIHTDGSMFTKAEASKLFALAYVDLMKLLYATLMVKEYVEPPPRDEKPGYQSGGQRGNYQGGGQRSQANNRPAANTGIVTTDELEEIGW